MAPTLEQILLTWRDYPELRIVVAALDGVVRYHAQDTWSNGAQVLLRYEVIQTTLDKLFPTRDWTMRDLVYGLFSLECKLGCVFWVLKTASSVHQPTMPTPTMEC